jgi:hypothetical protein
MAQQQSSVGAAGRIKVNAPCQSPDGKINTSRVNLSASVTSPERTETIITE